MIKTIYGKHIPEFKHNWIDQNNVVVGYDDSQQCCERFGWGVYNAETKVFVASEPDDLPYHFGEAIENVERENLLTILKLYELYEEPDIIHVELLPDDGKSPKLIFEFYNCHNGYYHHDFSIGTIDK